MTDRDHMPNNDHAARAEIRLAAAREMIPLLDPPPGARPRYDQLHTSIRYGLKLAEVEALLAIASSLQQLIDQGRPA